MKKLLLLLTGVLCTLSTWAYTYTAGDLEIKSLPTKTVYYAGEKFDPAGLMLLYWQSDDGSGNLYDYSANSSFFSIATLDNELTTNDKYVEVYVSGNANRTVKIPITVVSPAACDITSATVNGAGATISGNNIEAYIPNTEGTTIPVVLNLSNGATCDAGTSFDITLPDDVGETATKTVKVTSHDETTTKEYTITLTRTNFYVSVTTMPTKTVYVAGETFDPSGLVIKGSDTYAIYTIDYATYSDHYKSFTPSLSTALSTSDTKVVAIVGGFHYMETASVEIPITVTPADACDITAATINGAEATVNYSNIKAYIPVSDETSVPVVLTLSNGATCDHATSFNMELPTEKDKVSSQTVTVTSADGTATKEYTIKLTRARALTITTNPTKTTYFAGDTFDPTGLVVSYVSGINTTYSDTNKSNFTFSPSASTALTASDTKVLVSYTYANATNIYTVELPITVNPTTGKCGDDITWTYTPATGAMELTGTGDMYTTYTYPGGNNPTPWTTYPINSLSIGDGITKISDYAFYTPDQYHPTFKCSTVEIPSSVKSIGRAAFEGNYSITSLILHEGLEDIGVYSFRVAKITSLDIPSSVKTIEDDAFYACTALTSLTLHEGLETIGASAFQANGGIADLVLPSTLKEMGGTPFTNDDYTVTTNATLKSIPKINEYSFSGFATINVALTDASYVYSDAANNAYTSFTDDNNKITSMTYTRNMSNKWGTIVLPFDVESNSEVEYYGITGIDEDNSVLAISKYETLPAGTPALVKKLSGSSITSTATGTTINTELKNISVDDIIMKGSYVKDTRVTDSYAYYISNNKFYKNNEYFFVDAFRSYFEYLPTIIFEEEAKRSVLTIGENTATAINALTNDSADVKVEAIYDASGAVRTELSAGLNIIKLSNGKTQKILVK